jgi:hypothetical protein
MSTSTPSSGTSLGRRALALVVLLIAGVILFKVVLGFLAAVGTVLLIVFAIAAVIWAIRIL